MIWLNKRFCGITTEGWAVIIGVYIALALATWALIGWLQ